MAVVGYEVDVVHLGKGIQAVASVQIIVDEPPTFT